MKFKIEKIKPEDNTKFKIKYDKYSEVEIGGEEKDKFKPEVKLKKWGDECFIKISLPTTKDILPIEEDEKIKWKDTDKEVHLYPLEPTEQMEGGGFEFEVILKKKPKTNKIVLNIESQGLNFYYQQELTQKEIDDGASQPENVIGSYAVYHSTKGGMNSSLEKYNYKVGKAFHIYRPRINDADGNWAWSEQEIIIDNNGKGQQIITISQNFLDNAVYPIRHAGGDTIGYTTRGSSNFGINGAIWGGEWTMSEDGTVDTMHAAFNNSQTNNVKCNIYLDSDYSQVANGQTDEETDSIGVDFQTFIYSGAKPTLSNSVDYLLCTWADNTSSLNIKYDSLTNAQYTRRDIETYNGWPAPLAPAVNLTGRKLSVYATYTPGGAPAGTNMQINIGDVWKDVDKVEINIGDAWKDVTKIQINIGDTWKTVFEP